MGYGATVGFKSSTVVRVVQVDRMLVRESEDDTSQRVAASAVLSDTVLAGEQLCLCDVARVDGISCLAVGYEIAVAGKVGRIASPSADVIADNAAGYDPFGIYINARDGALKDGRFRAPGSTTDAHREYAVRAYCP